MFHRNAISIGMPGTYSSKGVAQLQLPWLTRFSTIAAVKVLQAELTAGADSATVCLLHDDLITIPNQQNACKVAGLRICLEPDICTFSDGRFMRPRAQAVDCDQDDA